MLHVEFREVTQTTWPLRHSRSFKVTDLGTNRNPICDFLLVINTNLAPILHRFQVNCPFTVPAKFPFTNFNLWCWWRCRLQQRCSRRLIWLTRFAACKPFQL